jgi:hypothetical protein
LADSILQWGRIQHLSSQETADNSHKSLKFATALLKIRIIMQLQNIGTRQLKKEKSLHPKKHRRVNSRNRRHQEASDLQFQKGTGALPQALSIRLNSENPNNIWIREAGIASYARARCPTDWPWPCEHAMAKQQTDQPKQNGKSKSMDK